MPNKRTVLLVDDNERLLSLAKVIFATRGYRVIACASGAEALQEFAKARVDLVVTDLDMPEMSGDELARQLKRLSKSTAVIVISGEIKNRDYALQSTAELFLGKGTCSTEELLAHARRLSRRKPGRKALQRPPVAKTAAGALRLQNKLHQGEADDNDKHEQDVNPARVQG